MNTEQRSENIFMYRKIQNEWIGMNRFFRVFFKIRRIYGNQIAGFFSEYYLQRILVKYFDFRHRDEIMS